MSLAFGRDILSIPGPSMIPDRVLQAMHRPAPNIYEGDLIDLTARIKDDLKEVAQTDGEALIYIANGHGGWEAALSNIVNRGDKLLALSTGRFTRGWIEIAKPLGADVTEIDFGTDAPIDPQKVEDALRADRAHEIRAVICVQTDTASSVKNDIKALRAAIDAAKHPALLMVDCIACLACDEYRMDEWGVDVTVSACQKGLMTPPGLAFNHINEKAIEARKRCDQTTGYWDWTMRRTPDVYYMNFYGTAPTHHLFGLGTAMDMILREEGIENTWKRHEILASSVWAAIEAWGTEGSISCNVTDRNNRSTAVTSVRTGDHDADALRRWSQDEAGLTLGINLGLTALGSARENGLFRIGHMGHLSPPMILGTIATIDAGFKKLNIPHGPGAIEAATRVIAKSETASNPKSSTNQSGTCCT